MILLECTVTLRDGDRKKLQEQLAAEIGQPVVLLPNGVSRAKERNILEILEIAAALEWIAMGAMVFFELRSQKRRLEEVIK